MRKGSISAVYAGDADYARDAVHTSQDEAAYRFSPHGALHQTIPPYTPDVRCVTRGAAAFQQSMVNLHRAAATTTFLQRS